MKKVAHDQCGHDDGHGRRDGRHEQHADGDCRFRRHCHIDANGAAADCHLCQQAHRDCEASA